MYQTGIAVNYTDLLGRLNKFLTTTGSAFSVTYAGLGDGRLTNYRGGAASVAEQITITAGYDQTFSVTGSASGPLGVARVGVEFSCPQVAFTIQPGDNAFVAGDKFTLYTAAPWVSLRAVAGSEYVWRAPGHDDQGGIYGGMLAYTQTTPEGALYNLRVVGCTGYTAGSTLTQQPGATDAPPSLALWNKSIPYWFVANGRRVVVVARVSATYHSAYLGLLQPYIDPGVYPYPLVAAGSSSGEALWSSTAAGVSNYAIPLSAGDANAASTLRLRAPSGSWRGLFADKAPRVFPEHDALTHLGQNVGGGYPLLPIVLTDDSPAAMYGQLDGVARLPGAGVAAETIVSVGALDYLVIPNVARGSTNDFFAVALD